jgi:Na+/H+ antiporter NhaD/arsenite permease-like protein
VARDALQTLINFFEGFVNFLIWLVILILPAGLVILALLWVLWRAFRFAWRRFFPRRVTKTKELEESRE